MAPRHRATARLARHVPQVEESSARLPARRMLHREEDPRPARPLPSDLVRVPAEVRVRSLRPVQLGPNAPLLIRLVRHPFALDPGRVVRRVEEGRERPSTLERPAAPHPAAEMAEVRASMRFVRPMREVRHRPEPRARPFGRARAEAEARVVFDPRAEEEWR